MISVMPSTEYKLYFVEDGDVWEEGDLYWNGVSWEYKVFSIGETILSNRTQNGYIARKIKASGEVAVVKSSSTCFDHRTTAEINKLIAEGYKLFEVKTEVTLDNSAGRLYDIIFILTKE